MVNAAVQYRNVLKKKLCCTAAVKARLLRQFDTMITAFLEERGDCTADDLTAAFGPPEEMAAVLMSEVTPSERTQYHRNTLLKKIIVCILAAVLILFAGYVLFIKEYSITAVDSTDVFDRTQEITSSIEQGGSIL